MGYILSREPANLRKNFRLMSWIFGRRQSESALVWHRSILSIRIEQSPPRAQDQGNKPRSGKNSRSLEGARRSLTNHDLKGLMACLTERAAIMGTGPGEIWVGPEDIKVAYEHFFEGFDKGEQNFEYQFKIGGVGADMGSWRPAM